MRSAGITLLLMIVTITQPLLAIPAPCTMQGERKAVMCAACCAVKPCCASSKQAESSPVAAAVNLASDFASLIPLQPIGLSVAVEQATEHPIFARVSREAHSPSPLLLHCIQLI